MNRRTLLAALALVATPLVASPAMALEEVAAQSLQANLVIDTSTLDRPTFIDARAKGFRSASRILTVALNCNAGSVSNAFRVEITTCSVRTDTGNVANRPNSTPAPVGTQAARLAIAGNKLVQVCATATVYFSSGTLTKTVSTCSGQILADI